MSTWRSEARTASTTLRRTRAPHFESCSTEVSAMAAQNRPPERPTPLGQAVLTEVQGQVHGEGLILPKHGTTRKIGKLDFFERENFLSVRDAVENESTSLWTAGNVCGRVSSTEFVSNTQRAHHKLKQGSKQPD